jgi:hypothetical protein
MVAQPFEVDQQGFNEAHLSSAEARARYFLVGIEVDVVQVAQAGVGPFSFERAAQDGNDALSAPYCVVDLPGADIGLR